MTGEHVQAAADRWTASRSGEAARPKVWADITDDEFIEAVRFACNDNERRRRDGGRWAESGAVNWALSSPTPEQWPDAGPNAVFGMGLIPRFGEGSASNHQVAARLRRLAKEGRLARIELVRPRGKAAPPGYIPADEKE